MLTSWGTAAGAVATAGAMNSESKMSETRQSFSMTSDGLRRYSLKRYVGNPRNKKGTWNVCKAKGLPAIELMFSCPKCGWFATFVDCHASHEGSRWENVTVDGDLVHTMTCANPRCGLVARIRFESWPWKPKARL